MKEIAPSQCIIEDIKSPVSSAGGIAPEEHCWSSGLYLLKDALQGHSGHPLDCFPIWEPSVKEGVLSGLH